MLAACDSGSGDSSASAPAATSDGPTGELSANDATEAELVSAFEAAGITNASQWAHEVEEYRPYPADDPDFAAGGHLNELSFHTIALYAFEENEWRDRSPDPRSE